VTEDDHKQTNDKQTNDMKKILTNYEIAHELLQDENASWTRAGAFALADHFESIEMETNEELELDVVAIRCDFTEAESLQNWIADYYGKPLGESIKLAGIDLDGEEDEDEIDGWIRSYIQDHGTLIEFSGGIIVSSF
jgi:hypothetical protein